MVYNHKRTERTRNKPLPVYVARFYGFLCSVDTRALVRVRMLHHRDDEGCYYVWASSEWVGYPDVCGPMSVNQANELADELGSRVQWLSRLILGPRFYEQRAEELSHEPTFYARKEIDCSRQGFVSLHCE